MNDTPKYILQKQYEIISAKPLKERIKGLFELTELSRKIIRNRIKNKFPGISETDLKIELFRIFYKQDFDKETLARITEQMKQNLYEEDSSEHDH